MSVYITHRHKALFQVYNSPSDIQISGQYIATVVTNQVAILSDRLLANSESFFRALFRVTHPATLQKLN